MSLELPLEGGCMCGRISLKISAPAMITMACHCKGCQKLSASAFSLSAMIPAAGFEVVRGETVIGALHGASRYHYCPNCLNWLFTRPAGADMVVNVRPTLFDVAAWSTPFIETFTSEKLAWAKTSATHAFDRFPAMDAYGKLMADYAAQAG